MDTFNTPNMTIKQIEILKAQISKLDNQDFDLDAWKGATNILLERIFGETYSGIKSINLIKNHVTDLTGLGGSYRNNIKQCKQQGKEILEASITEIESFGLPEKKEKNSSGIKIEMNQKQIVHVNIVLSVLEEELTCNQLDQIKELFDIEEPKATTKKKIIEKIESFGKDVAANILASILTNPSVWR